MAFFDVHFFSDTLQRACAMHVLLPEAARRPGGAARPRRPHPVLYLLHGLSDDHTAWTRQTAIERHAAARDLAVVMPAAGRSFFQDMAAGPRYWTFLGEELPGRVRSFFPVSDAREDGFAAGLSMGGYGAFRLALAHPDRFAAAASLSGALDLAAVVAERAGQDDDDARREQQAIFGPDPAVEGTGADLFELLRRAAGGAAPKPRLFQYCGTEDTLYGANTKFRDAARAAGFDLAYREDGGAHTWDRWDRHIADVIRWLPIRREASA